MKDKKQLPANQAYPDLIKNLAKANYHAHQLTKLLGQVSLGEDLKLSHPSINGYFKAARKEMENEK